jgi:AcrR family transcriptional regulator
MPTTAERVSNKRPSASRRLLDPASELFYAEGVQSVGIDRVIEKAGVANASLYNTFGSKEALVRAYLEERHAGTTARLTTAIASSGTPRDRILAVFAAQAELFAQPDFRAARLSRPRPRHLEAAWSNRLLTSTTPGFLACFETWRPTPEQPTQTCWPPSCSSSTTGPGWRRAWTVDLTSPCRHAQR